MENDNDFKQPSGFNNLNLEKNDIASQYYLHLNPHLSRVFSENCTFFKDKLKQKVSPYASCVYCKALFHSTNHCIRIIPKRKPCKKLKKIKKKCLKKGKSSLSKMERHILDLDEKNTALTIITCKVCKKKTKLQIPPKISNGKQSSTTVESVPDEVLSKSQKQKRKRKAKQGHGIVTSHEKSASLSKMCAPFPQIISHKAEYVTSASPDTVESRKVNNKKLRSKKSHGILQGMLAKADKDKKSNAGNLHSFLSNL